MNIESEPLFEIPTDDTIIYKYYTQFEYFKDLICSKSLYFSRISNWKVDPNEGIIPQEIYSKLVKFLIRNYGIPKERLLNDQVIHSHYERYKLLTNFSYACCFHINECESDYMWHKFAECPIAIKTSVKKIRHLLQAHSDNSFTFGSIIYDKTLVKEDFLENDAYRFFYKDKEFKEESEFRTLIIKPDQYELFKDKNPQYTSPLNNPPEFRDINLPEDWENKIKSDSGFHVPVKPESLIEEIILSPNADETFESYVKLFLATELGNSSNIIVKHSTLKNKINQS